MDIRYKLQETLEETEELTIYDPCSLDLSNFKFENGYFLHTLSQYEKIKPYLLSYIYYGIVDYENLILLINGVKDIWDLPIGTKLKIPKLEDLLNFIKDNKKQ